MKHAIHNLSSAAIWLDCDKYYGLKVAAEESGIEYDTAGEAAARGTYLHSISELALDPFLNGTILSEAITDAELLLDSQGEDRTLNDEDQEQVEIALHAVEQLIQTYQLSSINTEVVVPLSHEPGSSGYVDVAAVNSEYLAIIDYKYGVGAVRPEAPQLKGYGANLIDKIWSKLPEPKPRKVLLVIIQPKLYTEALVYETTVKELKRFQAYVDYTVERQKSAVDPRGASNLATCHWCPFKEGCGAYADLVISIADDAERGYGGLTDLQIERLHRSKPEITKVLKECTESIAGDEVRFPNWTRIQVPNARKWNSGIDQDEIAIELLNAGCPEPWVLTTPAKLRDKTKEKKALTLIEKYSVDAGHHVRLREGAPKVSDAKTEPAKRPAPVKDVEAISKKARTIVKKQSAKKATAKKAAAKKRASKKTAPKKKAASKKKKAAKRKGIA